MAGQDLSRRLRTCRPGHAGWKEYEDVCVDVLKYLFVPPLSEPIIQPRTHSGTHRRDAVFPNRNWSASNPWGQLLQELQARMILFEFKNSAKAIGKEEVDQICSYMRNPMGKLAILCCRRLPDRGAHFRRNTLFSDQGKVILFVTDEDLRKMLESKDRGEDPSDRVMDLVERFYLQHE